MNCKGRDEAAYARRYVGRGGRGKPGGYGAVQQGKGVVVGGKGDKGAQKGKA